MLKNLEQIRAASAIKFWHPEQGQPPSARGVNNGDVISKLPSLIVSNGLLQTTAFARSKGGGHEELITEVFRFLCHSERRVLPQRPEPRQGETELDTYVRLLSEGPEATSTRLQMATAEALAYLGYLKRFAP